MSEFSAYFAIKSDDANIRHLAMDSDLSNLKRLLNNRAAEMAKTNKLSGKRKNSEVTENLDENIFEDFLDTFSESMKGVYHLVSIYAYAQVRLKESFARRQIIDHASNNFTSLEKFGDHSIFGVPSELAHDFFLTIKEYDRFLDGASSLPEAVLMSLVAKFDAHFSSLVRSLMKKYPRIAGLTEKNIDVATVLKANSIEDLHNAIADEQIYNLMRGSHDDQIAFLEKFGRKIRDTDGYPAFLEVFERRNLVAHGEGRANARYEDRCKMYKVPHGERLRTGQSISLRIQYLKDSIDRLYEFGFLACWWLWIKLEKDQVEQAYTTALHATYDLILEERYSLASRIIQSVLSRDGKDVSEIGPRMLCLNRVNCLKTLNDPEWKDELSRFNWDASDDRFKVGVAALNEEIKTVCELMPKLIDEKIVGEDGFRNWPIFKWVREAQEYRDKFKEVFGTHLEGSIDTDQEIAQSDSEEAAKELSDARNDNAVRAPTPPPPAQR